jgi:hypothetical protein
VHGCPHEDPGKIADAAAGMVNEDPSDSIMDQMEESGAMEA